MKSKSQHRLAKNHRVGIFCFMALSAVLITSNLFLPDFYEKEISVEKVKPQLVALGEDSDFPSEIAIPSSPFNPNDYSYENWQKLGLSDKQIQTVFNYKKSLQGFKSKAQFRKCYGISEELYLKIEPFIDLPDSHQSARAYASIDRSNNNTYSSKQKFHFTYFDPNTYTREDWKRCGFSSKQVQTIMNYKNKFLGGKFSNVQELEKCYAISSEVYQQMKPYVRISDVKTSKSYLSPKIESIKESPQDKPKNELKPFKINDLDKEGWMNLGFTEKQVQTILKYKKYCGGKFHSLEEFKKCYVVSEEKFEELKPYILWD